MVMVAKQYKKIRKSLKGGGMCKHTKREKKGTII